MSKLNFLNAIINSDHLLHTMILDENTLDIHYDFRNSFSNLSVVTLNFNTYFVENLILSFQNPTKSNIKISVELRKGEQNFVYRKGAKILPSSQTVKMPLGEMNPYTSSINIVIFNSHTKGNIQVAHLV